MSGAAADGDREHGVEEYDVVVVGGGTAGCVVAARLAAAGVATALVEAGPSDHDRDEVLEVRRWPDLLGGELDWDYTIEPQPRGNSAIRHSRARVLGGCSSHNSCIAFVPPARDFRDWEASGATGWGPDGVAAAFARVLDRVELREVPPENPVNEAVLDACAAVGLPRTDFAAPDWFHPGAGRFRLNVVDGLRRSASVSYLHRSPDPLPTVLCDTQVHGLVMEGQRCVGVRTSRGELRAERVVVAAGAFGTPQLLMLAGIGPADHLGDLGVDPVVDLGGVGSNLADHPEGVVVFGARRAVPEPVVQEWEVGIFADVLGLDDGDPDLMFHLGLVPFDGHTAPMGYPTATHGLSLTPNVCRSRGRGTVRLRSTHPGDVPAIDFGYFTDPDGYDEAVMVAGVGLARRIMARPEVADWVEAELAPGPSVVDRDAVSEYVRRTANTVYHPVGTCAMGTDPAAGAVVDPASLAVHGTEGLFVADASVFPSIPSVNPAITVMMVGERCAEILLRDPRAERSRA